jgi:hypothetical protein
MIDLQSISVILASVSVILATVYYSFNIRYSRMNMRNTLETRQAQLFMQVYRSFYDPEFMKNIFRRMNREWADYEDYLQKYGRDSNPDSWGESVAAGGYFEGIGVLLEEELLDITKVEKLMGSIIINYWEKIQPLIYEMRERSGNQRVWKYFEYVYDAVVEERGGTTNTSQLD